MSSLDFVFNSIDGLVFFFLFIFLIIISSSIPEVTVQFPLDPSFSKWPLPRVLHAVIEKLPLKFHPVAIRAVVMYCYWY